MSDPNNYFFGYIGVASALVFANLGAAYGSAKAGLAAYLQGLRSVMWDKGVEVYTVKLGPVITPMTTEHKKNFSFSSIDKVVDIMIKRLSSRRYQCYVPPFWFWVMLAQGYARGVFFEGRFSSSVR